MNTDPLFSYLYEETGCQNHDLIRTAITKARGNLHVALTLLRDWINEAARDVS